MSQMKGQDKTPEKQLNEVQIHNLPEKEIRLMIVKMIQDLWKTMEKMQEMFMKDLLLLLLLLSHFSCVRLCGTPETATHQASLSLGFSKQEHWSGLPFPSPKHESEK